MTTKVRRPRGTVRLLIVGLVILCSIGLLASSMAGSADWPQRRADNQNTGAVGYGGDGTGDLVWKRLLTLFFPEGESPKAVTGCGSPAIGSGVFFVCSSYRDARQGEQYGGLTAFDATSGEALWGYEATHLIRSPRVASGLVYVETPAGMVALDVDTGALKWEVNTDGRGRGATFSDGVLYLSTLQDGSPGTYAVDARTGEILWQFPRRSLPVVVENDLVILSDSSGIAVLNAGTGDLMWEKTVYSYSKPAIWDGVSVWTSRQDVLAVDLVSGEEIWRANLSQFFTTGSGPMPVIYEGVVYVAMNWAVSGYDVHSGEVVVEEEWGFSLWGNPVIIDGTMYLLSQENTGRSGAMPWESADAVFWVVDMDSWEVVDEIRVEDLGIFDFSIRDGYLYALGHEWTKDSEMDKVIVMAFDVGGGTSSQVMSGEVTEIEWRTAPWLVEESQNDGFTTDDFEEMFNQTRNQTRPGGSGSNEAPFVGVPVLLVVVLVCLVSWRRRLL